MTDGPTRTVLVLAYSISPVRGSEYAVGWNYVKHMSERHKLIVLYGLAGDHMGDAHEIEAYCGPVSDRAQFVFVKPSWLARTINSLNTRGLLPFSFYPAYRLWHKSAARQAKAIAQTNTIDVVHYLCPIGFREPGYLRELDKPYIWGPIGGIAPRPARLFFGLGFAAGVKTVARNLVNAVQFRFVPRVARAIRETDLLLAATSENAEQIAHVYGRTTIVLPENALDDHVESAPSKVEIAQCDSHEPLRLVWVGTLEARKAITLLLRALALLPPGLWRLDVVGAGPLLDQAKAEAALRGIGGQITWHGKVARSEAVRCFRNADLHILTSLAEAHSTVLWEAMGLGVPTVAFDHCGMRDSLADGGGVKVPMGSLDEMVASLADTLATLSADRAALYRLKDGVQGVVERYSWSRRVRFWEDMYRLAINIHEQKASERAS